MPGKACQAPRGRPGHPQFHGEEQRVVRGRYSKLKLQRQVHRWAQSERRGGPACGQQELKHRVAKASAGPWVDTQGLGPQPGPTGPCVRPHLLAAIVTPQNLRYSLKMDTGDARISLAGPAGSGGQERRPRPLRAPRAAFEAEILSIFEDCCSGCGKVCKMLKI